MLALASTLKFHLYREPTEALGADPLSGGVFIFLNRRRDRMKLLLWDRDGFWVFYKRLEKGAFEQPVASPGVVIPRSTTPCASTCLGYFWVYYDPLNRRALFDYRQGRGRESLPPRRRGGPHECLENFQGTLQTDGYRVYEAFGKRDGVILYCCMAHARRKFAEARENDHPRAEYVLAGMQKLYAVERRARRCFIPWSQPQKPTASNRSHGCATYSPASRIIRVKISPRSCRKIGSL